MTGRRLACVDANGDLVGMIICDSDEAYEAAISKIKTWDLKDQRPEDLPSVDELKERDVQR